MTYTINLFCISHFLIILTMTIMIATIEIFIMLSTIWHDINHEAEAVVINDTKYSPTSLSNSLYDILDNRKKRKNATHKSKILRKDYNLISEHKLELVNDENISLMIESLFKQDEINNITDLDRVFLNAYYRRLLRSKLERDLIGKELVPGLVITSYTDYETDIALVSTLRYLRVICNYLGISSTTESATFPAEKLYMPTFWSSMSEKFVGVFGEKRITPIELDPEIPISPDASIVKNTDKTIIQFRVFMFLNIVFNTWSGSTLVFDDSSNNVHDDLSTVMVKIIPATYVTRMLPKLR